MKNKLILTMLFLCLLALQGYAQSLNPFGPRDSTIASRNIYGSDDRKEAATYGYKEYTYATAVAVSTSSFSGNNLYGYSLGEKLKKQYKADYVSDDVKFKDQPAFGFCSGFLIAPDLLVTAGHCIDYDNYLETEWIFDYTNDINYKPGQSIYIDPSKRYKTKEILTTILDDNTVQDYAVIRLDRPVDRAPFRFRTSNSIKVGEKVNMLGAPSGIPLKIVEGSTVTKSIYNQYFTTDLDAFGGNSGGPVFNQNGYIEGILVRGPTKGYVLDPDCNCVKTSRYESYEAVLFQGVDVTRITDIPWEYLTQAIYENLKYAIVNKDEDRLDDWMIYSWVMEDETIQSYENLVAVAAKNGNLEALKALILDGGDINAKDLNGKGLLRLAVDSKNAEMIDYLIKQGLNPNEKDQYGSTAVMWAINNYDPTTLEIIIKKGGEVNATNEHGDTPLHEAVRQDSWTMVDVLLNNGANIFAKNAEGQTPRKLAKKLKHKSLKKYLKKQEKSRK